MEFEQVLVAIERNLLGRQLTSVEQQVLRLSWRGWSYHDMSEEIGYAVGYLKDIGALLWAELSDCLGQAVSKKNVTRVLEQYCQDELDPNGPISSFDLACMFQTGLVGSISEPLTLLDGPLPLDSPFYIERPPLEAKALAAIEQPGCLLRLKSPQHTGKSSLLRRILAQATKLEYARACIDLQTAEIETLSSLDRLLRWLCACICQQLDLPLKLDKYWLSDVGSKVNFRLFLERYVLVQVGAPLVLSINAIDRLFEYQDVTQDFLPLLRSCYEDATDNLRWQQLRLILVYATEMYVPLKLHQSPFNVGVALTLPPFTSEQSRQLAVCYQLDWLPLDVIHQLHTFLGGHPYCLNLAYYALNQDAEFTPETMQERLSGFIGKMTTKSCIYRDYLRGYLAILQQYPPLTIALRQVLDHPEGANLDAITAYKLESLGLIRLQGDLSVISCALYHRYFDRELSAMMQHAD